jgi:hypothetical protein
MLHSEISSQLLGSTKCFPKWWNPSPATSTHSQRMCEDVSISAWHLPQIELSLIPSWKRWPSKWQCPVNRPVTCLAWDLLSFRKSTILLAESLERKLFACFCPAMDCQCPWWSLHIHFLMTCAARGHFTKCWISGCWRWCWRKCAGP